MKNLQKFLEAEITGFEKTAILGVGSDLRGDDAAGLLIAKKLEGIKGGKTKVFLGHTAPENLSGEIRKYAPKHVIIIDAADIGKRPGEVAVFSPENAGGISFSTHKLPIKMMAEYLENEIGCRVTMIGIQPKNLDFGSPLSREVSAAVKETSLQIRKVLARPRAD